MCLCGEHFVDFVTNLAVVIYHHSHGGSDAFILSVDCVCGRTETVKHGGKVVVFNADDLRNP